MVYVSGKGNIKYLIKEIEELQGILQKETTHSQEEEDNLIEELNNLSKAISHLRIAHSYERKRERE